MYAGIVALLMAQAKFVFSDAPAATPVPGLITRLHTTQAQVARWFTLFYLLRTKDPKKCFRSIYHQKWRVHQKQRGSLTSFGLSNVFFERGRKHFGLSDAVCDYGRQQLKQASQLHQEERQCVSSIRRSGCNRDWILHKQSTWVFYSKYSRTWVHNALTSLRPIGRGRAYVLKQFFWVCRYLTMMASCMVCREAIQFVLFNMSPHGTIL